MTSLEASTLLFTWFKDNDSFEMGEDFIKIVTITDTPRRDKAAVKIALDRFVDNSVLSKTIIEDSEFWVLEKPFVAYEQTLTISPESALHVSNLVNKACENLNIESELCDPSNITERDLQNLLYLCGRLFEEPENKA